MFGTVRIRRGAALFLSGAAALMIVAPGPSAALASGPSNPDAAQLMLTTSDFAPGTTASDSPASGGPGVVSSHARSFKTPTTRGGVTFLSVFSQVLVLGDLQSAQAGFDAAFRRLRSRGGRTQLTQEVVSGIGQGGNRHHRVAVRIGRLRTLAIGDAAVLLPFSFKLHGLRLSFELVLERVNRGVAILAFGGLGGRSQTGAVIALARTQADRMRAGFASGA